MYKTKAQGNDHKVAGTQERRISKRVAEICSKYGIEFEDKMLRYCKVSIYGSQGYWVLAPFRTTLTAPGQIEGYKPTVDIGMIKLDNRDTWYGYNCKKGDFEDSEIAAFDEISAILV